MGCYYKDKWITKKKTIGDIKAYSDLVTDLIKTKDLKDQLQHIYNYFSSNDIPKRSVFSEFIRKHK